MLNLVVVADNYSLGKTIQVIAFVSDRMVYVADDQLSAIMRKTGTAQDFERRKRTIRTSRESLTAKHWPTALIVCPKSLISNVCSSFQSKKLANSVSVGTRAQYGKIRAHTPTIYG
jgi:SNF2 family DNA or RNA helicase